MDKCSRFQRFCQINLACQLMIAAVRANYPYLIEVSAYTDEVTLHAQAPTHEAAHILKDIIAAELKHERYKLPNWVTEFNKVRAWWTYTTEINGVHIVIYAIRGNSKTTKGVCTTE